MNIELGPEVPPASQALLLLTSRGAPLLAQRQRLRLLAEQLGLSVRGERVFRRRRRGGLGEQLRAVIPSGAAVVLVDRLAALSRGGDPVMPLLAAAEIRALGVVLASAAPDEDWVLEIGSSLPAVGAWLDSARREQRREQARVALSRVRAQGRRLGRPRKVIDLGIAMPLAGSIGIERAAAELKVGASTLRRALRAASAGPASASPPASPSWSPAVLAGGVQ